MWWLDAGLSFSCQTSGRHQPREPSNAPQASSDVHSPTFPYEESQTVNTSRSPGGGERIRTAGLLRARQALCQLSYTPSLEELVGLGRVELPTSRLSGVRSHHLSYRPMSEMKIADFKPLTGYLKSAISHALSQSATSQCQRTRTDVSKLDRRDRAGEFRSRSFGRPHRQAPSPRRSCRKEVIQPQVLLGLPCYDFTPVTDHTVVPCLPPEGGLAPGPSSAARFRDVTGGVYKTRERIHRGVADPRLLAIPASRRRVAACDPNWDRLFGIGSPSRVRSPLYRPL